jgi:Domain of unknown function (DUF222)
MRTSGGGVVDRVAGLAAAVASLAEVDPADLPAAAQLDLLRQVWPVLCQLDAQVTRMVGAVHAQGSAAQEGAVSTAAWLRSRLHAGNVGQRVQVAKALRELPELAAAFEQGEITFAHAQIAVKAAKDLDPVVLAGGADKLLAEEACAQPPGKFADAAAQIRDHFNPDAADKRTRDLQTEWLDVDKTFGGAVSISGVLAPDTGELLLQTLGALMPPVNPDDLVAATTRRALALGELCRLAADAGPQAGGSKPQVTVTIDWDTLRGQTTDLFDQHGAWTGGRLRSGTPIAPETARRLACDCGLIPMVLGAASEPLDVGRKQRLVTPAIRRALEVRDGGCRFPGCDRPVSWCDAHHLRHWVHDGETSIWNMILLCRRHHVLVHECGWSIHLDHHAGTVTATDPRGKQLDLVSHPRAHSP